ncbi:MAG: hypothetical protein GY928_21695 [Colwellia sp.]|nr:hypothetical protein [Colwellia sp.]
MIRTTLFALYCLMLTGGNNSSSNTETNEIIPPQDVTNTVTPINTGQTGKKQAISRDHLTDLNDRGL